MSTDTRIPDADPDVSNVRTTALNLHGDISSTDVTVPQIHTTALNIDYSTSDEDAGDQHRAVSTTRTLPVTAQHLSLSSPMPGKVSQRTMYCISVSIQRAWGTTGSAA